ncbi:I78 family peptidase inhibitor [Wenxinia marina]|uniref:Peptidase inhibitor I78 family n=1 Tax=Wenxinia marina DSM 24838 TaxID=1123501 RepID=A0A0D0PF71_9RHOB|nr:I78 family peptidase inhibitor [Wenxinia marina]KIQ70016.1 Peptidase inhibitor I78 family [Wenxinia marina DSM 24838]GGL62883.1 hypothetical protein GCM10011392_16910 [Wenxinia marina]
MMRLAPLPLIALLAACEMVPPPPQDVPPEPSDACGASGYQWLVGQSLAAVTLPADLNARVLEPDDVVTMEYVATRLNIYLGQDGLVDRVTCG